MFDDFDREWRFMLNNDGTITRGRLYRLPEDWTADSWQFYWDGDFTVAFVIDGWHAPVALTFGDDTDRALRAWRESNRNEAALDRVAQRVTGNCNASFVTVEVDRGTTVYAMSYDGDPEREWRDEIQNVAWGNIYRIECEDFDEHLGWTPSDEYPDEFYGEDKARAEWERVFDLAEFPAERFVGASN